MPLTDPLLSFLSEPQAFSCNLGLFSPQLPAYKFHLNGEDLYSPDLPLETLRAKGDTMALWDSHIDLYVTVLPTTSPAVLPLLLDIPGFSSSVHIGVYLPMIGQEHE